MGNPSPSYSDDSKENIEELYAWKLSNSKTEDERQQIISERDTMMEILRAVLDDGRPVESVAEVAFQKNMFTWLISVFHRMSAPLYMKNEDDQLLLLDGILTFVWLGFQHKKWGQSNPLRARETPEYLHVDRKQKGCDPYMLRPFKRKDGNPPTKFHEIAWNFVQNAQAHLNSSNQMEKLVFEAVFADATHHADLNTIFQSDFIDGFQRLLTRICGEGRLYKRTFGQVTLIETEPKKIFEDVMRTISEVSMKIRALAEEEMDEEFLKALYIVSHDYVLNNLSDIAKRTFKQVYRSMDRHERRMWILTRFQTCKRLGGPVFSPFFGQIFNESKALNNFLYRTGDRMMSLIDLGIAKKRAKVVPELSVLWVAYLRFYPLFVAAEYNWEDERKRIDERYRATSTDGEPEKFVLSLDSEFEGENEESTSLHEVIPNGNERELSDNLEATDLMFAYRKLPKKRRIIVEMFVQGMDESAIADKLGVKRQTVEKSLQLAVKTLQVKGVLDLVRRLKPYRQ